MIKGNLLVPFLEAWRQQCLLATRRGVETVEGWLYLAVVLGRFSRMVVGWAMAERGDEHLVTLALRMALARRHPRAGLLHHSDRGSEYTSRGYQALLTQLGIEVSMSGTANCDDHAAMESFFDKLKSECVKRAYFQSRAQARSVIFVYHECWYNPVRLHSTLQYVSPLVYEQAFVQSMRSPGLRLPQIWVMVNFSLSGGSSSVARLLSPS